MIYLFHIEHPENTRYAPTLYNVSTQGSFHKAIAEIYPNNKPYKIAQLFTDLIKHAGFPLPSGLCCTGPDPLDFMWAALKDSRIQILFADIAFLTPNELGDVSHCLMPDHLFLPIPNDKPFSSVNMRRRINARYLLDSDRVFKHILMTCNMPECGLDLARL